MSKKIFITGKPKTGKSTLIKEIIEKFKVLKAGVITPEIIEKGIRTGFKIIELSTGVEGIMAHINSAGPKVGKYYVNVPEIDKICSIAVENFESAEILIIDEIGKMEVYSKKFLEMLQLFLNSEKPLIATLHLNYVRKFKNFKVFYLEKGNYYFVKSEISKNFGEN